MVKKQGPSSHAKAWNSEEQGPSQVPLLSLSLSLSLSFLYAFFVGSFLGGRTTPTPPLSILFIILFFNRAFAKQDHHYVSMFGDWIWKNENSIFLR
jgi:hypothetical protein